jgi:hypothetical protein
MPILLASVFRKKEKQRFVGFEVVRAVVIDAAIFSVIVPHNPYFNRRTFEVISVETSVNIRTQTASYLQFLFLTNP